MPKVNPKDFLLNTDYEMDKIILVMEGKLTGPQELNIPYTFPFKPLVFGLCSYNEDFSIPKPLPYAEDPEFVGSAINPIIRNKITATATVLNQEIIINYKNTNQSPAALYYRIYAFEPTDANVKINATIGKAKTFTLDTDRNYRKLFRKGIINAGERLIIDHNFGYVPQVMLWGEQKIYDDTRVTNNIVTTDDSNIIITKNKFDITAPQIGGAVTESKIHYRIYYDEA